ncbi:sensor histidine kinase [Cellulomonas soli]|uniref:sensor histidine kinase n=1 Tax=Cellulomonas soli TaxID=931535 RepID=UPI0015CC86DF|nr:ATP-binding protein [Cellulomonas soli]NYI60088.1 hypothetical protein [Cellulomonas soli]
MFVLGVVAVDMGTGGLHVAPWWPAAGVGVLAMLAVPRRWAAPAAAGVWAVTAAANLVGGRPLGLALAFGAANTAEVLVVAGLLTRGGRRPRLQGVRDATALLLAAAAGSAVAGVLAGGAVAVLAGGAFVATAVTVAASHGSALLTVVPIALGDDRRVPGGTRLLRVAQPVALLLVVLAVFWPQHHLPLTFLPMPFLVWGVFQLSPRRAAVQVLVLAVLVTTLTAAGGGPFAAEGLWTDLQRVAVVQVFLVTSAASVVLLAAARCEQLLLGEQLAEREQLLRGGILDAQVGLVVLHEDAQGRTWIVQSNAKAAELLAPAVPLVDLGRRVDGVGGADGADGASGSTDDRAGPDRGARRPRTRVPLQAEPGSPAAAFVRLVEGSAGAPGGEVRAELALGVDGARDVELIVTRSGRPAGGSLLTVQAVDVTARRRAERAARHALQDERRAAEELRALDQQRADFVSAVSHELRTPITNIVGFTEVLRDDGDLTDSQREQLDVVGRNARRLGVLVENLLALGSSRVRPSGSVGTVQARPVCAAVVEELAPLARRSGVDLRLQDGSDVAVVFDRGDLRRVLANLVRNAVQFSPPGGQVSVGLTADEEDGDPVCRLTVVDSGPGIPADELEHVFDRFSRGRQAERDAAPGVGLGLALVRDLVRRNHASVVLRSGGETGTTAVVTGLRPVVSDDRGGPAA